MTAVPSEPPGSPRRRVVYVDDNRAIADTTVTLLRLSGFDARACYDGQSALRLVSEFEPAVCFLDLNMPGMDGDEVAARLRARDGCPRLVAVTAVGGEEGRRRTAEFDLYFVKPADPVHLVAAARALSRPRSADS